MALPLPNILSNVGPGGPVVSSMMGGNALLNSILENKYNAVKAKYAPLSIPAKAFSEIAYSNLAGPQFTAKMLENAYIAGNLTPEQYREGLKKVYNAGINGGVGNDAINALLQDVANESRSPFENLVGTVSKALGFNNQPSQNAIATPMSQQRPQPMMQQQPVQPQVNMPVNAGYSYDNQGNNVRATPQQVASIANEDLSKVGTGDEQPTPAENAGNFMGVIEEKKELGTGRGKAINQYGEDYKVASQEKTLLDQIGETLTSPEYLSVRQLPYAGSMEINVLAKTGTREQQRVIGKLLADINKVHQVASTGFKGTYRVGEQGIVDKMKVNEGDTLDVALGKLSALQYMNQVTLARSYQTQRLMQEKHMNEADALNAVDKIIDTKQIMKNIENTLGSFVTLKDPKTHKIITLTVQDARSRGARV